MLKIAFSTVACPAWTLDQVATAADEWGYESVELRTFGYDSRLFACDPALTDGAKVRRIFGQRGIEFAALGTSHRFDEPVTPPVVGLLMGDPDRCVTEAKISVDLAIALGCPYVRVFGFDIPRRAKRRPTLLRIARRLAVVADHAHRTGVKILLENGGGFPVAGDIAEVISEVGSPLVGACYSIAPAASQGETPRMGIDMLGDRLWAARIKDLRDGRPCPLGEGELPCRDTVHTLAQRGFDGPLIYEWDRAWIPDLAPAESILPDAARTLYRWVAEATGGAGAEQPSAAVA